MRPSYRHIVAALLPLLLLVSCQKPKGIISRNDMARIYADMIVADQWIAIQTAEIRRQSDTTQFYEPIFNKYGYTLSDYLVSVDYYLNDPERFSRILKKTESILQNVKEMDETILGTDQGLEEDDEVQQEMDSDDDYVIGEDAADKGIPVPPKREIGERKRRRVGL